MLKIGSKYKIAKRLGAGVFEQTQTQKFALSEARTKNTKERRGRRGGSDYGRQLLEKQKLRYTYGLSERQLSNYVKASFALKDPALSLHRALELRADNVVYRSGLAPTRRASRQMVSHGHIKVNGKRITIPSYAVSKGDSVDVREGSRKSAMYGKITDPEEVGSLRKTSWIKFDPNLMHAEITGEPAYSPVDAGIDYSTVFEFYSR